MILYNSIYKINISLKIIYGKNDFAERSKILLTTALRIILLKYQNNYSLNLNQWIVTNYPVAYLLGTG